MKEIVEFRKKVEFTEFVIMISKKYSIKSKIGKILAIQKILQKCHVKVYKVDTYFDKNYKEKLKVDKNGHEYMLFRPDFF